MLLHSSSCRSPRHAWHPSLKLRGRQQLPDRDLKHARCRSPAQDNGRREQKTTAFFLYPGNPAHSCLRDLRLHRHTTQQGITAVSQVFAGEEVKKAFNRGCKRQQAEKPIFPSGNSLFERMLRSLSDRTASNPCQNGISPCELRFLTEEFRVDSGSCPY